MASVSTTLGSPEVSGAFFAQGAYATLGAPTLSGAFYVSVRVVELQVIASDDCDVFAVACLTTGVQCEAASSVNLGVTV